MSRSFTARAFALGAMVIGAVSASVTTADAQPMDRLNFTGSANLSNNPGSGGSQLLIDFLVAGATANPGMDGTVMAVETISGEFESIAPGTVGTIEDLVVDVDGVVGAPIVNFLEIGGFQFTLVGSGEGNTFGPISLVQTETRPGSFSTAGFFGIFGTVTGPGLTMERNFSGLFTAQFNGQTADQVIAQVNSAEGYRAVGFSAEFTLQDAAVVPEPSTYILLATGLGGLGLVGLRRRATQA